MTSAAVCKSFGRRGSLIVRLLWLIAGAFAFATSSLFASEMMDWAFLRDSVAPGLPPACAGAVCWRANDGSTYLFSAGTSNDLWRYDPVGGKWAIEKPGKPASYGTRGVSSPANAPSARTGAFSWIGPDGALYLFGGSGRAASGDMGWLNDLWKFDLATRQWTWLTGSSSANQNGVFGTLGEAGSDNTPCARSSGVSWTGADGALYLFGGSVWSQSSAACVDDLWRYDIGTSQWTWLKGSQATNQSAVYGRRGEPASDNTPGARFGAASWTRADGTLYLFGDGGSRNDLWRYDVSTNTWTWLNGSDHDSQAGVYGTRGVAADGNAPGARSGAASWTGLDGALYLFGGEGHAASGRGFARSNDLWRYDVVTNQWVWLKGSGSVDDHRGVYGVAGVAAPANTPGARDRAMSWIGRDGGLCLFEGYGYAASECGYLNDLWHYDISTNQWTWLVGADSVYPYGVYGTQGVTGRENTPGARQDSCSWAAPDGALYVFGGLGYAASDSTGDLNDLWRCDTRTMEWTWLKGSSSVYAYGICARQGVPAAGNTPGARHDAVSWTGPDNAFYLFGGCGYGISGSYGYLNDLWRYDVSTSQWTWLKGPNSSGQPGVYATQGEFSVENVPDGRGGAASWTGSDGRLYLFAGGDLWCYDIALNQWAWMKGSYSMGQYGSYGTQGVAAPDIAPGFRSNAVCWAGSDHSLYLFGGDGYGGPGAYGHLNDLWRYDITTSQWTWLGGSDAADQPGAYGGPGVTAAEVAPGGRSGAVSWAGMDGTLYLFGGEGYDACAVYGRLDDVWRYDTTTNQWTWLCGSDAVNQVATYAGAGVPASGNTPGARLGAVSWVGLDGSLCLFGGYAYKGFGDYVHMNDIWKCTPAQSDLAVSVNTDPLTRVGDEISYFIGVRNNGPDTARDVTLNTVLPSGLQFVGASANAGTVTQGLGGQVAARLGALAADKSRSIVLTLRSTSPGTFSCETSGTSMTQDPFSGDNVATATVAVRALCADVSISAEATSDTVVLGGSVTYQIKINNSGLDAATNTIVSATVPIGVRYVGSSSTQGNTSLVGGLVVAELGTLAVGTTAIVSVVLQPTLPGSLVVQIAATSDPSDPNTPNNMFAIATRVLVGSGPDLKVTLSGATTKARKGRSGVTWQISGKLAVTNAGDKTADKCTAQVFVSDTPTIPQGQASQVTVKLNSIKAGKSARGTGTVSLPVNVTPKGKYVIAVVDSGRTVAEANEFNNVCVFGPLP